MHIQYLLYFVAVARTRSMTKTANIHHTTQQNVSRAIQTLEEELNVILFERTNSGMILTDDGHKAYFHALKTIDSFNGLKDAFSKSNSKLYDINMNIGMVYGSYGLINGCFSKLISEYPNISIDITEQTFSYFEDLLTDQFDVLILSTIKENCEKYINSHTQYEAHFISEEVSKILINKVSRISSYNSISVKKLQELPLIAYFNKYDRNMIGSSDILSKLLDSETIHIVYSGNSTEVQSELLKNNIGYTFSTSSLSKRYLDQHNLAVIPLSEKILISNYILIHKEKCDHKVYKYLLDLVLKNN